MPNLSVRIDFSILPPSRGKDGKRFIRHKDRFISAKTLKSIPRPEKIKNKTRLKNGPLNAIRNSFSELRMYPFLSFAEIPKG